MNVIYKIKKAIYKKMKSRTVINIIKKNICKKIIREYWRCRNYIRIEPKQYGVSKDFMEMVLKDFKKKGFCVKEFNYHNGKEPDVTYIIEWQHRIEL